MATIGRYGGYCIENHRVYVNDRGGMRRIGELLDVSMVRWERVRDEISEATVVLRGSACVEQREFLAGIEPKRSEIAIYRGSERVWEGPVTRVGWETDTVEIAAHDIMEYVWGTVLSKDWDNRYRDEYDDEGNNLGPISRPTEVSQRIEEIVNYEMDLEWEQLDPPANVLPYFMRWTFPNEARTAAHTTPYQMTVGEHIDNLARTAGVDYTVVGRSLQVWDVSRWIGELRTMTEQDFFGDVIVTAYGADLATRAYAVASDGTAGSASSDDDYYGPWAKVFTVYDEDDEDEVAPSVAELNSQAQRNLSGRNPVPIEVRVPDNSSIRLSPGLEIGDLVPGTRVPLLATLNARQVSQLQKIHQVVVTENSDGENIALTMVPATSEDTDEEGGE